jgi:hypothetical protein
MDFGCKSRILNAKSDRVKAEYLSGIILTLIIFQLFSDATAQSANPVVFPIDSKPYGSSYDQWAIKWWKWFVSFPASVSPASDPTGTKCAQSQNDPNVWYLAATFGGKAERTCTIPAGKALFFTVIGTECNTKQDKVTTQAQFQACVRGVMDGLKSATAQLDGADIPNVELYRITSSVFPVTFPNGAVWGAPPGPTNLSSDAVYLMLHPLSKGTHILHFTGQVFNPTNPAYNQATDVTYHLIVK